LRSLAPERLASLCGTPCPRASSDSLLDKCRELLPDYADD
jgi:hypothetical protein